MERGRAGLSNGTLDIGKLMVNGGRDEETASDPGDEMDVDSEDVRV